MSDAILAQGLSALGGALDQWGQANKDQSTSATLTKAYKQWIAQQNGGQAPSTSPLSALSSGTPAGGSSGGSSADPSTPPPLAYAPTDPSSPAPPAQPPAPSQPSAQSSRSLGTPGLPSIAAVQGTPSGGGIGDMLNGLNDQYGLPPGFLIRTAGLESNFNVNAYNKGSGASGPFQFVPSTASQYGVSNPFDWQQSAVGAAQLASDNAKVLANALGRPPTGGELYLAHQQGAGGAAALLTNPTARAGDVVGDAAVRANGGDPNMPAGAFAAKWTSKFPGATGNLGGGPMDVGNSSSSPPAGNALGPAGIIGVRSAAQQDPSPYGSLAPFDTTQGAPQPPTADNAQPAPTPDGTPPPLRSGFPNLGSLSGAGMTTAAQREGQAPGTPPATSTTLPINQPPSLPTAQPQGGPPAAVPAPQPAQPPAMAYTAPPAAPAPAQAAIGTVTGAPYGSQPLNINGKMLTRQQAEDTDGLDHTDYDYAAARAGLIGNPAAAPPFVDAGGSAPAAGAASPSPGGAGPQAATPAPVAAPPTFTPVSPQSPVAARADILTLLANPDTRDVGAKLWEQQVTGKNYGFVKADDGSYWSQDPTTGVMTQRTAAISAPFSLSSNEKRFSGTGTLIASNPDDKPDTVDNQLATFFSKNPGALAAYAAAKSMPDKGQNISIMTGGDNQIETKYGEAVGTDIAGTIAAAGAAPQGLAQIAQMRDAVAQAGSNLTTGPFAQTVLKGKEAVGGALGIQIPGTSEAEVINDIGYGLASQAARMISNRPTQFEFSNALAVKPGLSVSPQGLQALLTIKAQDLQDQQNLAQLAMDPTNRKNWPAVKQAYYAAHPVMSPFRPGQPLGQADVDAFGAVSGAPRTSGVPAIPQGGRVQVNNAADYNALPSGARYLDPAGIPRVKP